MGTIKTWQMLALTNLLTTNLKSVIKISSSIGQLFIGPMHFFPFLTNVSIHFLLVFGNKILTGFFGCECLPHQSLITCCAAVAWKTCIENQILKKKPFQTKSPCGPLNLW